MFVIFSATPQFEIEVVNQTKTEGVEGRSLTLKWMFNHIPENYKIFSANLYFNGTTSSVRNVICNWNSALQTPSVTNMGMNMFGRRIMISYISNIYNFTLTNFQHNDAGPYLLGE